MKRTLHTPGIGVRLVYALIAAGAAFAVALSVYSGEVSFKDLVTSLPALLGTFLGATLAFRLNEDKDAERLQASRRAALNRALFVLMRQYNAISQLFVELDRFTSPQERAFTMPALQPPPYSDLVHNFVDLEFLLEGPDPNLLLQLTIEQERFHQALQSLRVRNDHYVAEVQPAIEKLSLHGKVVRDDEVHRLLGERIYAGAVNSANVAHVHFRDSNKSLPETQRALLQVCRSMFPGHKFVTYEREA